MNLKNSSKVLSRINIKTKFETEKLGLSLADTITEYIRKDLNLNLKGFILNSKNSLKNFI